MSIIKAGVIHEGTRAAQGVAFNLADMTIQADEHLGKVRRRASEIIAQARRDAEQIRQEAEQQGREAAAAAAKKAMRAQIEQQVKTLLPALNRVIEEIRQDRHAWIKHWEDNVVHLASSIAARVIRRELTRSPEIPLDLIKEALQLAAGNGNLKLYLNPKDHETLRPQIEPFAAEIARLAPTDILADEQITPGGCRVTTEFGQIDQQIQTQLARIEEELT